MGKFTEWRNIKYFTRYKEIFNTDSLLKMPTFYYLCSFRPGFLIPNINENLVYSESCGSRDCGIFYRIKKYWVIVEIFVFFLVSLFHSGPIPAFSLCHYPPPCKYIMNIFYVTVSDWQYEYKNLCQTFYTIEWKMSYLCTRQNSFCLYMGDSR